MEYLTQTSLIYINLSNTNKGGKLQLSCPISSSIQLDDPLAIAFFYPFLCTAPNGNQYCQLEVSTIICIFFQNQRLAVSLLTTCPSGFIIFSIFTVYLMTQTKILESSFISLSFAYPTHTHLVNFKNMFLSPFFIFIPIVTTLV